MFRDNCLRSKRLAGFLRAGKLADKTPLSGLTQIFEKVVGLIYTDGTDLARTVRICSVESARWMVWCSELRISNFRKRGQYRGYSIGRRGRACRS